MTKQEARKIATAMNLWRRGESGSLVMPRQNEFGIAIDVPTQPSTIADNIRNSAINWPHFAGDVECHILYAFASVFELSDFQAIQDRTFMLFVAEALES